MKKLLWITAQALAIAAMIAVLVCIIYVEIGG
jgi:hypothetical protein